MCGIVGYIGDKNCFPILIKGCSVSNTAGTTALVSLFLTARMRSK